MADPEREPVTASDFFHKGLEELQRGEYAAALKSIDNAIQRNYFGADVALTKGEILFELRRYDESLEWIDRATAMDPTIVAEAALLKARVYFEKGTFSRALSAINRAMDGVGSPGEAWLLKGMVLTERGDGQKALAALEEAKALTGDDTAKLADVLFWEGRALRTMRRFAEATARLERVLALEPSHAEGYNELAEVYRTQGMLDQACEIYRRGIRETPEQPMIHNDYGNTLRDLGRLDEALEELNKAAALDESVGTCIFNRATVFERMERWEDALSDYSTVLEENPSDTEAQLRCIDILARMGRYSDAREAYYTLPEAERRRAEVQDVYARYLNRRCRDLEKQGSQTTALQIYRELLAISPDLLDLEYAGKQFVSGTVRGRKILQQLDAIGEDDPNGSLVPLIRALVTFRIGPRDLAQQELERCLESGEFAEVVRTHLAEVYALDRNDPERALQSLDIALKLRPNYVQALWGKAEVLDDMLGDSAGALACYREILRVMPGAPSVLDAMGNLYLRVGDPLRALRCYRELLDVTPSERAARRSMAIARLELGQLRVAIGELETIRDEDPYDPITRVTLAAALAQQGELEAAASLLDQLASSSRGYDWSIEAIMREVRAEILNKSARPTEALRALRTMRTQDMSASGVLQRGLAQLAAGDTEAGRMSLKEVIRDMPGGTRVSRDARIALAKLHMQQHRTAAARELLEDTLKAFPFSRRARALLIWALRELGEVDEMEAQEQELVGCEELRPIVRQLYREEFDEAREELRSLSRRRSQHAETLYWLAASELALQEYDDALLTVKRMLELKPELEARARSDAFFDEFVFSDLTDDLSSDDDDWLSGIDFEG